MEKKRKSFPSNLLAGKKLDIRHLLLAGAVIATALVVTGLFYKLCYHGLRSRDAADIAQISANVSSGHGFTTRFVRPSNALYFKDAGRYYPELNRGPLYPTAVAMAFKARSKSEQVVAWTSTAFFLLTLVGVYVLGRMIFDRRAGLLSVALYGLSQPILSSAISGEQWTMCTLLFTLLLIVLAAHHKSTDSDSPRRGTTYAVLSAVLVGLLYMADPVMVFLAPPTAVYFGVTGAARRANLAAFIIACVAFITPWSIRNMTATGIPVLGAAGWDIAGRTSVYPNDTFYRTVELTNHSFTKLLMFPTEHFGAVAGKVAGGITALGGSMMSSLGYLTMAFSIVGMLYRFRNSTANALRGYNYGVVPAMVFWFAAYSVDLDSMSMFAPLAAVLAAAYFLLLLDAKKLHAFFVKLLVGGLLVLTAYPTLTTMAQRGTAPVTDEEQELALLLAGETFTGWSEKAPVYTDVPWMVAWKTMGVGVWVPVSDTDCQMLAGVPLPLNILLLTSESEKFANDEIWYVLHSTKAWRGYVRDKDQGVEDIMKAAGITVKQYPKAPAIIERMLRKFKSAGSVKGFTEIVRDPLKPDHIQLFVRSEAD